MNEVLEKIIYDLKREVGNALTACNLYSDQATSKYIAQLLNRSAKKFEALFHKFEDDSNA